jgi:hypothetical protein
MMALGPFCLSSESRKHIWPGVDAARDLRATLVVGALELSDVEALIRHQDAGGIDPFLALDADGHDCRGLELVKAHVRSVREGRVERVRTMMEIPELWALELSPALRSLLHEMQHAHAEGAPSLGRAGATLRDALVLGLNELARVASVPGLDVASEREPEGTHVSPVVAGRRSEPPPSR